MKKQNFFLATSALLLVSVISVGAYFAFEKFNSKEDAKGKPAVDIPLESARSNQNAAATDLSVKGSQTTPNQQQNTLPAPDQFSLYEEYANSDGVRFIDTKFGTGQEATGGDTVAVVYAGWLTDGKMFDRSPVNESGQVEAYGFTIGAGSVIQGWELGIAGMKEGGERRLIIPSQFGYGENGGGDGAIPPNAMLIFDVELVQVQKASN